VGFSIILLRGCSRKSKKEGEGGNENRDHPHH